MTELEALIQSIPKNAIVAVTGGEKKNKYKVLVRPANPADIMTWGRVHYMVCCCPGCGFSIPIVEFKPSGTWIIVGHNVLGAQGEAVCGYGGESLEFQSELPVVQK